MCTGTRGTGPLCLITRAPQGLRRTLAPAGSGRRRQAQGARIVDYKETADWDFTVPLLINIYALVTWLPTLPHSPWLHQT